MPHPSRSSDVICVKGAPTSERTTGAGISGCHTHHVSRPDFQAPCTAVVRVVPWRTKVGKNERPRSASHSAPGMPRFLPDDGLMARKAYARSFVTSQPRHGSGLS